MSPHSLETVLLGFSLWILVLLTWCLLVFIRDGNKKELKETLLWIVVIVAAILMVLGVGVTGK